MISTSKKNLEIRRLTVRDRDQTFRLRKLAYSASNVHLKNSNFLDWSALDDRNFLIGLFEKDVLVSCYRLDTVADFETLSSELHLDFSTPDSRLEAGDEKTNFALAELTSPVGLGCRAATLPSAQHNGYHLALRNVTLRYSKSIGLRWVYGTSLANQSWTKRLVRMGYEVLHNQEVWNTFLHSTEMKVVYRLDLQKNLDRALGEIELGAIHEGS